LDAKIHEGGRAEWVKILKILPDRTDAIFSGNRGFIEEVGMNPRIKTDKDATGNPKQRARKDEKKASNEKSVRTMKRQFKPREERSGKFLKKTGSEFSKKGNRPHLLVSGTN